MKLPKDLRDIILDFKHSMELHERYQRVLTELEIDNFFRCLLKIYRMFLEIDI